MSEQDDWDNWIEAVQADGVNLSTWEIDFVESLEAQRKQGRRLSEKQVETLERIYAEKTP